MYSIHDKAKLAGAILVLVFLVQVILILTSTTILSQDSGSDNNAFTRRRLRPRHAMDTEVRGSTYHVHRLTLITDRVIRDSYARWRRNVETVKPRFLARRTLSEKTDAHKPEDESRKFYKMVSGAVGSLKLQCGSCAIVGSAGTLTAAKTGDIVDSSDCVFRLGLAPVIGYEEDVGSKTTVRVVDGKSFSTLAKRPQKLVTGGLSSPVWVVFDQDLVVDTLKLGLNMLGLRRIDPNFAVYILTRRGENQALADMKEAARQIGFKLPNYHPSTLWYALQAAQESGCSNITMVGVPDHLFCKRAEQTWTRYWGKASPPFCSMGKDSGLGGPPAELQLLSLGDRRALQGLASTVPGFKFVAPSWPL